MESPERVLFFPKLAERHASIVSTASNIAAPPIGTGRQCGAKASERRLTKREKEQSKHRRTSSCIWSTDIERASGWSSPA